MNNNLNIADSKGNVIGSFENGHIKTKNFYSDVKNINATVEKGGISITDGLELFALESIESASRTAFFISTAKAKMISTSVDCFVLQYDVNYNYIGSIRCIKGNFNELSQNSNYIRVIYLGKDDLANIGIGFSNCDGYPKEIKKVQQRNPQEKIIFHVEGNVYTQALLMLPPNYTTEGSKVPLIVWDSGDGSYTNWDNYEMGAGYKERINGLNYLRDQGFAIVEIYSWGSYYYKKHPLCGERSAMPVPTHLKTHEKGVEYVCSRYNIDADNIFHISKSGSGKLALHYAMVKPKFNLKAIYAFAPVFDDLNFGGIGMRDYRRALMEDLNFAGTEKELATFYNGNTVEEGSKTGQGWVFGTNKAYTDLSADNPILINTIKANQDFIKKNADKFTYLSVNWSNLIGQTIEEKIKDTFDFGEKFWSSGIDYGSDIHETDCYNRHNLLMIGNRIPIKAVMAKNDSQTPYWNCLEVINQLRNGGTDASIITLTTQGHDAPDMGIGENAVTNITTRLGIHYDSVSIGWVVACNDIIDRFIR